MQLHKTKKAMFVSGWSILLWLFWLVACSAPPQAAVPTTSPTSTVTAAPSSTPSPQPTLSLRVDFDQTPTVQPAATPRPADHKSAEVAALAHEPVAQVVAIHGGNLRTEPRIAPETVQAQVCPGDQLALLEQQETNGIVWLHVSVVAVESDCVDGRAAIQSDGWLSSVLVSEPDTAALPEGQVASNTSVEMPEQPVLPPPAELISGTYTLESNLKLPAEVTGAQLDEFVRTVYPESPLIGMGDVWVQAGEHYRINPVYLLAHAIEASNWGTSSIARQQHNLYHWGGSVECAEDCTNHFDDPAAGVFYVAGRINQDYLSPDGVHYNGATLRNLGQGYASDPEWATTVVSYMNWVAEFLQIKSIHVTPVAFPYADDMRLVQPACFQIVQAALTAEGKPYTQAAGRRSGPNSFDCSGLAWWSYTQAGITADLQGRAFGSTTYTQIFNGERTECTLDDLNGAATTCWAPGDLVFIRYPGGQHVAVYVGKGLFSDCYSSATGCILHDISDNSFYRQYFWQARRVLPDCAGVAIDPETLIQNPILVTHGSEAIAAPGS